MVRASASAGVLEINVVQTYCATVQAKFRHGLPQELHSNLSDSVTPQPLTQLNLFAILFDADQVRLFTAAAFTQYRGSSALQTPLFVGFRCELVWYPARLWYSSHTTNLAQGRI